MAAQGQKDLWGEAWVLGVSFSQEVPWCRHANGNHYLPTRNLYDLQNQSKLEAGRNLRLLKGKQIKKKRPSLYQKWFTYSTQGWSGHKETRDTNQRDSLTCTTWCPFVRCLPSKNSLTHSVLIIHGSSVLSSHVNTELAPRGNAGFLWISGHSVFLSPSVHHLVSCVFLFKDTLLNNCWLPHFALTASSTIRHAWAKLTNCILSVRNIPDLG